LPPPKAASGKVHGHNESQRQCESDRPNRFGRYVVAQCELDDQVVFLSFALNWHTLDPVYIVIPAFHKSWPDGANNLQQSWRFDWEPPKAVLRDVWTIDWILGC
jgi:hypothetical protein